MGRREDHGVPRDQVANGVQHLEPGLRDARTPKGTRKKGTRKSTHAPRAVCRRGRAQNAAGRKKEERKNDKQV